MNPTNQQVIDQLKILSDRIDETGEFLESVAFALANQYKLMASRVESFSPEERDLLTSSAQVCLDGVEKQKLLRKKFRDVSASFSKN